jgi:hypothetical protein
MRGAEAKAPLVFSMKGEVANRMKGGKSFNLKGTT